MNYLWNTSHRRIVILIMMMTVIAGVSLAQDGATVQEVNACLPVDVVLVIDQSESMLTSDNRNLRIDAAQSLIDALFIHAAIDCENLVTHRIAAVGFNNENTILLPPQEIFVADASDETWETRMNTMKTQLVDSTRNSITGRTAVGRALLGDNASAQTILEGWQRVDIGDASIRQSAIILVTDGTPCNPNANCGSDWVRQFFYADRSQIYNPNNYIQDGFDTQDGLISAMDQLDEDVQVNVFLFSDDANTDNYGGTGEAWQQITSTRNGRYLSPDDIQEISDITAGVGDILIDILSLQVTTLECNVPFYLEPYISATTVISSIRPNVDANIRIEGPDGDINDEASNVEYLRLETIERYIITAPTPGEWVIRGDPSLCDQIDPRLQTTTVEVATEPFPDNVLVEIDEPYVIEDETLQKYARIRLNDRLREMPFSEFTENPLDVCGLVTHLETGTVINECLPFNSIPDVPGTWQSTALPAPLQGTYNIQISSTVASINPDTQGQRIDVFGGDGQAVIEGQYTTAPPEEVYFDIRIIDSFSRTADSYIMSVNNVGDGDRTSKPIEVIVQLVDSNDTPVNLLELFRPDQFGTNLDEVMTVTLNGVETATNSIEESSPLTFNAVADGSFVATLRDIDEVDPEGNYQLQIALSSDAQNNFNDQNYAIPENDPTIELSRLALEGVRFDVTTLETPTLLNTVDDDGVRLNNPIPIAIRIANQAGIPLSVDDIFAGTVNTTQLITAQLIANNQVVEEIQLIPATNNTQPEFTGIFRDDQSTTVDAEGIYEVRLFFNEDITLPADKQSDYLLLTTAVTPAEIALERIPRFGVNVLQAGINNLTDPDGTSFRLNELDVNLDNAPSQTSVHYTLYAQLTSPDGQSYTDEEIQEMVVSDVHDMLLATITRPGGEEQTFSMSYIGNNRFESRFRTADLDGTLYEEGTYTISYSINPDQFIADALSRYQITDRTDSVDIFLDEQEGVQLFLTNLGDQSRLDEQPLPASINLELYQTILQAAGLPLIPGDAVPQDVPFVFEIQDTSGEARGWDSLIPASDADAENEDDETEPTFSDVVQVRVIAEDDTEFLITDLQFEGTRITGTISNEASQGGSYTLEYSLDDTLLREDIQGFSSDTQTLPFVRNVDHFLRDPDFWIIVEIFMLFVIALLILRLMWLNIVNRMSGTVHVTWNRNMKNPT
ncbi:MAG: hypothetical protein ACPG7F_07535, partial [Aggregatilineales bacterium]